MSVKGKEIGKDSEDRSFPCLSAVEETVMMLERQHFLLTFNFVVVGVTAE